MSFVARMVNWELLTNLGMMMGIVVILFTYLNIKYNDLKHIDGKIDKIDSKVDNYHKDVVNMIKQIAKIEAKCEERHR